MTRSGLILGWRRLWAASPTLMVVTVGLVPVALLAALGLVLDGRLITGSPAWLKPLKFALSSSIYCGTVAWLIASVPAPSRWLRGAGVTIGAGLALEVGIIAVQAMRGVRSHFNVATPLDAALFATMGLTVLALVVASTVVAVALARTRFEDRAWGWALKLGMAVTVIGSTTGGFMVRPTAAQVAGMQATGAMATSGAHTVGGPDGGPGFPLVNWSRAHGDVRVPHFFGLHAIQLVPLGAWLVLRRRDRPAATRLGLVAWVAAGYSSLIALLTVQALAGRPVVALDAWTVVAFGTWLGVVAAGWLVLDARARSQTIASLAPAGA